MLQLGHIDKAAHSSYARLEDTGYMLGRFIEEVGARMPTPDEDGG